MIGLLLIRRERHKDTELHNSPSADRGAVVILLMQTSHSYVTSSSGRNA